MTASPPPWTMRSVLVSVRDLTRSISFYCDVLGLRETAREGEVVVLEPEQRNFAMFLRETTGRGIRHGQQELGSRALSFDVGSQEELDGVAGRLATAEALVSRSPLHASEPVEVVAGRDPDGLPLVFFSYGAAPLHPDHYRHVALHMYGIDV